MRLRGELDEVIHRPMAVIRIRNLVCYKEGHPTYVGIFSVVSLESCLSIALLSFIP